MTGARATPGGSVAEMYGLESKVSVRRRLRDMLVLVASGRKAGCLAQSGKGSKPVRLPRLRNSANRYETDRTASFGKIRVQETQRWTDQIELRSTLGRDCSLRGRRPLVEPQGEKRQAVS